ncbi:MAG: type secretion exporter [Pelosinus sp.]|jgi:flagellar biosynthesis protein|nr:type secretion exporter [Pelosinus sp.]
MNKNQSDRPQQAIALTYQKSNNTAPKVVAKGTGFMAEKILSTAKQHSVPVYQNKTLASMLMAVELDREIPPELYQAVAEILAYIYHIDKKMNKF